MMGLDVYRAEAAELWRKQFEKRKNQPLDVVTRLELPDALEAQWKEYLARAAKIGRPAIVYRGMRDYRRLGTEEVCENEILRAYVMEVAKPAFESFKLFGYKRVKRSDEEERKYEEGILKEKEKEEKRLRIQLFVVRFYREPQQQKWKQWKQLNELTTPLNRDSKAPLHPQAVEDQAQKFSRRVLEDKTSTCETSSPECAALDSVETIKAIYAGRPDEIYRRKSSKKFATYKRKRQEQQRTEQNKVRRAEVEMLRRRENAGDRVRSKTDSLNPFLFCNEKNTFAYCTKLPDAGRLKEGMLEKYSHVEEVAESASAVEILTSKPSFNLRIWPYKTTSNA